MSRVFSLPQIRSAVFYATVWGAMGANILFWNRMILTESFSLSMLCLFIAGWLLALQQRRYFLLFASGLALLFLRDTMVYLVVPFSATLFIWQRDIRLVVFLSLLALSSFQAASWAHEGQRYSYSLYLIHFQVLLLIFTNAPHAIGWRMVAIAMVLSHAVAIGFWWLFERHYKRIGAYIKSARRKLTTNS